MQTKVRRQNQSDLRNSNGYKNGKKSEAENKSFKRLKNTKHA